MFPVTTNPKARADFERRMLPTVGELLFGSPAQIEGLTTEAGNLKRFAQNAKQTLKTIGERHFAISDDQTLNDAARLVRSAQHAETRIKEVRASYGQLTESAMTRYGGLQREINAVLKPPSSHGEASIDNEMRAYLRTLKPDALMGVLRSNPSAMAAAARAPALLSGLNKDVHKTIQGEYAHHVLPDVARQVDDLKQAIATGIEAISAVESESAKLIDFKTAASLQGKVVAV